MSSLAGFSWEKRPLKRPRLGPPDVYPQDAKQREDELTALNVKQGFSHIPQISDEFGTAKNCNISAAKLGAFINGAISRKIELNVLPDSGKRRLQVNTKDNFWAVTPSRKHVVEAWMKDLAGTKPLSQLAKKVPIFNKKEEIFITLAEHNVPMLRAAWFLKMTASHNSAISEAKTKKRQMPDPSQEWTLSLLRCLKDILVRLVDWYNGGTGIVAPPSNPSNISSSLQTGSNAVQVKTEAGYSSSSMPNNSSGALSSTDDRDGSICLRQWQYCTDLAKHLYHEGLLDRAEWICWVLEACERAKTLEDGSWKALIPVLLSYLPDIAQSEFNARRLATLATRRLSVLFTDYDQNNMSNGSHIVPPQALIDHLNCPSHRTTVLALVSALQVITLECPTALVCSGNSSLNVPGGSPLDLISVSPSALPMPPRANNPIIRAQLRAAEEQVRLRSRAVEAKWSCEEWQPVEGRTLEKVLTALDALDRQKFDKIEANNTLETLYSKVFPTPPVRDNPEADAPIVILLCQWAVGPQRCGEHRALAVARLLEHRQSDATSMVSEPDTQQNGDANESNGQKSGQGSDMNVSSQDDVANGPDMLGDANGNGSNNGSRSGHEDDGETYSGLPIYHNLLFKFLDTDAPTLDESSPQSKATFASLVHLFSALIRHDIFSHDAYLCTLVARGDLSTTIPTTTGPAITGNAPSVQPLQSVATPGSHPGPATPASVSSVTPCATPHHDIIDDRGPLFPPLPRIQEMPRQPDYDDRNIDDDLDRILQHITQEQQNNMEREVDSPKEDNPSGGTPGGFGSMSTPSHQSNNSNGVDPAQGNSKISNGNASDPSKQSRESRHRLYVMHFPLPQDESYQHEANQRHILLYGVGRSRDEARHVVKKVSKDLGKLFSKKFCYDVADGSRVKKHSKTEINMDSLQTRFCALPYFDQHAVTSFAAQSVVEMLSSFASGRSSYLPTTEHVAFLTELMEAALHITGLLEACVQMLRELPEIESQLIMKSSSVAQFSLVGTYTTSLELQLVAILRRYHCSLLLDQELTVGASENLTRLMRRLSSTSDCTSAERCALAYIFEMQTCCEYLKKKNSIECLPAVAAKIRPTLCGSFQPSESSQKWNNSFMTPCLDNPRRKVDHSLIRQLVDNPACRHSFVCNAILSICNEADTERLNDLASLCAEMTAACPTLASEWLGVLQCLCSSPGLDAAYGEIFTEIDVKHLSIHSSLATLTALLVARQCFSLENFVCQAVPSLLKAWNEGRGPNDPDTEAGARLTCSLLLSLFKAQESVLVNPNASLSVLKLSCDRRLLSATHNSITLGAVLAVLKAMLLLADAAGSGERRRDQRNISGMSQGELSISHILGTSDVPSERCDSMRGEPRTLASFAFNALQQMCSEAWVRQRCLQCPEDLCNTDMLLDSIVSTRQAQRLLHLICYPDMPLPEDGLDPRSHIPRIMEGLDQWNLREAWLALTLQNKQLSASPMEQQSWLDIVARAALDVFHIGDEGQDYISSATPSPAPGKSPRSGKKSQDQIAKTPPNSNGSNSNSFPNHRHANGDSTDKQPGKSHPSTAAWLVASLLEKLSPTVQGRVLRHAGNVLENTLWTKLPTKKKPSGDNSSSSTLQAHLPFLSLILTCLKGQDEQRDVLLGSLLNQFTQLLSHSKDPDTDGKTEVLRDALRLRLNLVGGLFDSIQRSVSATSDWAIVLTQLVTHSVVDLHNNCDVFPTIVDMVTALVHSTQTTDNGERIEDTRKQNMNLMKKLKKELTDRNSESIKPLRQLLPFSKAQAEIIVTQPTSTIIDSRGNRVQSFEFVDKKPGLQVWEKQRVSPWELVEGQRNPAPLSWAWFGAVKMERKQLRYEEAHRLLKYHEHSLVKPSSHFLEPPLLPPEDVDVKPEIVIKEEIILKPDTPSSDQSPRGTPAAGRKPKAPRKKRQTKAQQQQAAAQAAAATAAAQQIPPPVSQPPVPNTTPIRPGSPYGPAPPQSLVSQAPSNYPPGPPPQWYAGSGQQSYYPAQPPPGVRPGNQTKQGVHALQTLLRARHPTAGPPQSGPNQFQQFPQGAAPQRHQILRTQLRGQAPGPPMQNQPFPPNQGVMYSQQQMQQQALNQNYGYNQGNPQGSMPQGPMTGPQGSMNQGPMPGVPQGSMPQGPMTQGPMTGPQGSMNQGPMPSGPFAGRGIPQRSFLPGGINGPGPGMGNMQTNTNYRMNMGMGQPGGQNMNQMGGQPGQAMNQMGQQGGQNMNQMGGQPGQAMNQMGQQGGQSMNQMSQQGGQSMNQMGQPGQNMNQMGGQSGGMPNMPHNNAQRFRHMLAMQQQQQQQQQQMGMGGPRGGPMHNFNPNQSGY